ncbi:MAG TPA: endolytic transglycosylase MltG [Bacteroidetes bacterium]|nr:endolytic transglycosylase MltG [Bacteroidota bacterium]
MNGSIVNNKLFLLFVVVFLCVVILFSIVFFFPNSFTPSPKFITVSKGQSFSSLADSLEKREIILNAFTFKIAGRLLGYTQKMRIGKYSFVSGISNLDLLNDLEGGLSTVSTSVTLREGVRAQIFARILKRHIGIDSIRFMKFFADTSLIGIYPNNSPSLEGYLMPNTYNFFWQDDEREIIQRMITEFREFFVDTLQQRMKQLGYSLNDVMTMASIVEGEAVYDDERAIIAGVYYNRLKKRMRLQADPTVLYAVSAVPRRLTRTDLKFESEYNTYLNYGLPPGPINNPGKQSIIAALYPAKHNFIYFVADNNGRHRFAKNYEEHQRNVRLYRKARALAKNGV